MSTVIEVKKKVTAISRKKKLRHFFSLFKEGDSVLDVGVSAESSEHLPWRNHFLKNYRYDLKTYTGLGTQDLSRMNKLFPGRRFVQYGGGKFPFSDKEFDWVYSNAVIEHVGDKNAQLLFLNEMMRVSNCVFFTTPNKLFPVETHTNIPFLHWNASLFYKWCEKKHRWICREGLSLLSLNQLRALLKQSNSTSFSIYKNRFAGLTMTFSVICTGKSSVS